MKTSHGMTNLIIDAAEFKFANASNYELTSHCFHIIKPLKISKYWLMVR